VAQFKQKSIPGEGGRVAPPASENPIIFSDTARGGTASAWLVPHPAYWKPIPWRAPLPPCEWDVGCDADDEHPTIFGCWQ